MHPAKSGRRGCYNSIVGEKPTNRFYTRPKQTLIKGQHMIKRFFKWLKDKKQGRANRLALVSYLETKTDNDYNHAIFSNSAGTVRCAAGWAIDLFPYLENQRSWAGDMVAVDLDKLTECLGISCRRMIETFSGELTREEVIELLRK